MTIKELQAEVLQYMTKNQVREFGNLSYKATWQAALDKCSEAIAAAVDAAAEAQQPAQETAEAVTDALYSTTSRAVAQWMATAILMVIFTLGLITVRITQATWQAMEPLRSRAVGRIHSELWAFVGAWPDLLIGL